MIKLTCKFLSFCMGIPRNSLDLKFVNLSCSTFSVNTLTVPNASSRCFSAFITFYKIKLNLEN